MYNLTLRKTPVIKVLIENVDLVEGIDKLTEKALSKEKHSSKNWPKFLFKYFQYKTRDKSVRSNFDSRNNSWSLRTQNFVVKFNEREQQIRVYKKLLLYSYLIFQSDLKQIKYCDIKWVIGMLSL